MTRITLVGVCAVFLLHCVLFAGAYMLDKRVRALCGGIVRFDALQYG